MDRLRANQVNEHRSDPLPSGAEKKPFWFFPPRDRDPVFEGRDPHEPVKTDWMGNQFPRPWHIATLLFGVALAVYLALSILIGREGDAAAGSLLAFSPETAVTLDRAALAPPPPAATAPPAPEEEGSAVAPVSGCRKGSSRDSPSWP